jgi:hypothetical protein
MHVTPFMLALSVMAVAATAAIGGAGAQDDHKNIVAADIVAAQIRAQGFACDTPQSAKRDARASKPNEAVWLLTCENASYRVTFVPDMSAKVKTLGGKADGKAGGKDKQD